MEIPNSQFVKETEKDLELFSVYELQDMINTQMSATKHSCDALKSILTPSSSFITLKQAAQDVHTEYNLLKNQVESYQSQIITLSQKLQSKEMSQESDLHIQSQQLHAQISLLKKLNIALQDQLKISFKRTDESSETHQQQLEFFTKENDILIHEIHNIEADSDLQVGALVAIINSYKIQMSAMNKSRIDAELKVSKLLNTCQDYQSLETTLTDSIAEKDSVINSLNGKINELESNTIENTQEIIKPFLEKISELEFQLSQKDETMLNILSEMSQMECNLTSQLSGKSMYIQSITEQLDDYKNIIEANHSSNYNENALQLEIANCNSKIEHQQSEIYRLQEILSGKELQETKLKNENDLNIAILEDSDNESVKMEQDLRNIQENLYSKISTLEGEQQLLLNESTKVQKELEISKQNILNLENSLQNMKNEAAEQLRKMENYVNEKIDLDTKNSELLAVIQDLNEKISLLESGSLSHAEINREAEAKNAELLAVIQDLNEKISLLESGSLSHAELTREAETKNVELLAVIQDLNEKISLLESGSLSHAELTREAESKNAELLAVIQDLNEKISLLESGSLSHAELTREAESKNAELLAVIQDLNEKISLLESGSLSHAELTREAESKNAELLAVIQDLNEKISLLESGSLSHAELTREAETKNAELLAVIQDLNEKVLLLESGSLSHAEINREAESKNAELLAVIQDLNEKVSLLESGSLSHAELTREAESKNAELLAVIQDLNEKISLLESGSLSHAELTREAESKNAELLAVIQDLNEKVLLLESGSLSHAEINREAESKNAELLAVIQDLNEKVSLLESGSLSHAELTRKAESKNAELLAVIQDLNEKISLLESGSTSSYKDVEDANNTTLMEIERLIKEKELLQSQIEQLNSSLQDIVPMKNQHIVNEEEIQFYKNEVTQKNEIIAEMNGQSDQMNHKISKLELENNSKAEKISVLSNVCNELNNSINYISSMQETAMANMLASIDGIHEKFKKVQKIQDVLLHQSKLAHESKLKLEKLVEMQLQDFKIQTDENLTRFNDQLSIQESQLSQNFIEMKEMKDAEIEKYKNIYEQEIMNSSTNVERLKLQELELTQIKLEYEKISRDLIDLNDKFDEINMEKAFLEKSLIETKCLLDNQASNFDKILMEKDEHFKIVGNELEKAGSAIDSLKTENIEKTTLLEDVHNRNELLFGQLEKIREDLILKTQKVEEMSEFANSKDNLLQEECSKSEALKSQCEELKIQIANIRDKLQSEISANSDLQQALDSEKNKLKEMENQVYQKKAECDNQSEEYLLKVESLDRVLSTTRSEMDLKESEILKELEKWKDLAQQYKLKLDSVMGNIKADSNVRSSHASARTIVSSGTNSKRILESNNTINTTPANKKSKSAESNRVSTIKQSLSNSALETPSVDYKSKKIVICFSGFKESSKKFNLALKDELCAAIAQFKDAVVFQGQGSNDEFDSSITHLIAPPTTRTLKTFAASLKSVWIIHDPNWIIDSLKSKAWLPEIAYGNKFRINPFEDKKYFMADTFNEIPSKQEFRVRYVTYLLDECANAKRVEKESEADIVFKGDMDKK